MTAILEGLTAAALWATATVSSSRSSRMIGAASVLAWVMLVGFVVTMPFAVWQFPRGGISGIDLVWLTVAGVGTLGGLLFEYAGLAVGKVGIVAPIASTEGAIAAVFAAAAGERISPLAGIVLAEITAGIVVAGLAPDRPAPGASGGSGRTLTATLWAVAAAATFGVALYAAGRVAGDVPLAIAIVPARIAGVVVLLAPLALFGKLRLSRRAVPLVVLSGLCEIAGLAAFTLGARHGIAVAAVLGSQFAAFAAVAAFLLFRERLSRLQLAGVVAIVAGVAVLSAARP